MSLWVINTRFPLESRYFCFLISLFHDNELITLNAKVTFFAAKKNIYHINTGILFIIHTCTLKSSFRTEAPHQNRLTDQIEVTVPLFWSYHKSNFLYSMKYFITKFFRHFDNDFGTFNTPFWEITWMILELNFIKYQSCNLRRTNKLH